ncbi:MAG: dihydrodipicolinate synthase family protein [Bryobacterales bacterium]
MSSLRLASIPSVVAVKEASGSIGQMAQICQRMPADFAVLSGDDAVTLANSSLPRQRIISVVSNQIPAKLAQLCNLALAGDFAGALAMGRPMMVNFCETSPERSGCHGQDGALPRGLSTAHGPDCGRQPRQGGRGAGLGGAAVRILQTAALLLACACLALAQRSDWTRPFEAHRIIGNLYYVGTYDLACFWWRAMKGHTF